MKYQPGDKVRIRSDLKVGARYPCDDITHTLTCFASMAAHRGQIVTIRRLSGKVYDVHENVFSWSLGMLEDINGYDDQGMVVDAVLCSMFNSLMQ